MTEDPLFPDFGSFTSLEQEPLAFSYHPKKNHNETSLNESEIELFWAEFQSESSSREKVSIVVENGEIKKEFENLSDNERSLMAGYFLRNRDSPFDQECILNLSEVGENDLPEKEARINYSREVRWLTNKKLIRFKILNLEVKENF